MIKFLLDYKPKTDFFCVSYTDTEISFFNCKNLSSTELRLRLPLKRKPTHIPEFMCFVTELDYSDIICGLKKCLR